MQSYRFPPLHCLFPRWCVDHGEQCDQAARKAVHICISICKNLLGFLAPQSPAVMVLACGWVFCQHPLTVAGRCSLGNCLSGWSGVLSALSAPPQSLLRSAVTPWVYPADFRKMVSWLSLYSSPPCTNLPILFVPNRSLGRPGEGRSGFYLPNCGVTLVCFWECSVKLTSPIVPRGKHHRYPLFNGFLLSQSKHGPLSMASLQGWWSGTTCLMIYFSLTFLFSFHNHQGRKDWASSSLFSVCSETVLVSYFLRLHLPFP